MGQKCGITVPHFLGLAVPLVSDRSAKGVAESPEEKLV